jgi:two-component system response regulator NreC
VCPHSQIHGIFAGKKIRCVLVHDHVLVRQGLCRLLEDEPELEVVAEAGNAADALQLVFEQRPDVVLADSHTMGLPSEDAERLFLRESPDSRVFFLGRRECDDSASLGGVTRGETGHVPPQTSAEELFAMVRREVRSNIKVKSDASGDADGASPRVHEMPRSREGEWLPAEIPTTRKRSLTAREHEVLKLLAEGQTVRSAAGVLGLSAKTVDAHKFNLMRKLGIHNKAELVMWAIQKRVVKLPVNF